MDQIASALLQTGIAGAVLLWFMFRLEPRVKALEESIDRQVRASMLDLIARNHLHPEVQRQARQIVEEIERKTTH